MQARAPSAPITWQTRLRGLWALLHPGPSLITALAYALCCLLAAHGRPSAVTLLVTSAGMLAVQFAISALNDYRDRTADAHSHKNKPLARGVFPPLVALAVTAVAVAVYVACYVPYGWAPLLIAGGFLILGFAYDLGLKVTPVGAALVGLAFSLLPLLAWDLFATLKPALFWTVPLGLIVGVAIHLADAAPDAAADAAAGAHGLAQALGRSTLPTCWALLVAANALVIVLAASGATTARILPLAVATLLSLLATLAAVVIGLRASVGEPWRLRAHFFLCVFAALATALGWLASAIV